MRTPPILELNRALVAASLVLAVPAMAQLGSATITGTVTDALTHKPVEDVVVTATSPQAQGEQTVVTDATGVYRVPQLPPGTYTIRFEKDAYKPYARSDVSLRIDATTRFNVELPPDTLFVDEIVTYHPPTIDIGSSSTGITIGSDIIDKLALVNPGARGGAQRSFETLAGMAPTAGADLYGVSISGTTSVENKYVIDGVNNGDPGYGVNGTALSVEFVRQLDVITGGYMPEYGRSTGGTLNAVTKSGSNEFHGSLFGYFTPGALNGTPNVVNTNGSIFKNTFGIWNSGDFGAEVGGPILKDKLWFYAGVNPSFQRAYDTQQIAALSYVNGAGQPCSPTGVSANDPTNGNQPDPMSAATYTTQNSLPGISSSYPSDNSGCHIQIGKDGLIVSNPIAGTERTYFSDKKAIGYIGKLTYLLTQDHTLTLSVYGAPSTTGNGTSLPYNTQTDSPFAGPVVGDPSALYTTNYQSSNTVSLKESSSFFEKHLLVDVTLGWYHQEDGTIPGDGSPLGSTQGQAGMPSVLYQRTYNSSFLNGTPGPNNVIGAESILQFQDLGPADSACTNRQQSAVGNQQNALLCPIVPNPAGVWFSGGPGYVTQASLDRYEGNAILTYILNAAGHHIFKAGADVEVDNYDRVKAVTGLVQFQEATTGTSWTAARDFGFLTGPDTPFFQAVKQATTQSIVAGGFLQDSYSVLDLFTINAGVRYDQQSIIGADGQLGMNMPGQWAPRVGFIFDPTQKGRSKVFGSYSVNFLTFPLDLADRSLPGEPQLVAAVNSPLGGGTCTNPVTQTLGPNPTPTHFGGGGCDPTNPSNLALVAGPPDPNRVYSAFGGSREAIDPNIQPESTEEWNAGAEYQLIDRGRLGLTYDHRDYRNVIEDMSPDEGNTFFIGNPGYGLASDRPRAVRNYDAVSLYFTKEFSDLWMAQASYTWSQLVGNYEGLIETNYGGQLDPGISAAFDLKSLLPNTYGSLPGDITHRIKLFLAKKFVVTGAQSVDLGLGFTASSGSPLNYLGAQYIYGPGIVYLLPQGSAGNLPWLYNTDGHVAYTYQVSKDTAITAGVDLFNMFNFQNVTSVDQNYTVQNVLPVTTSRGPCTGTMPGSNASDCSGGSLTPSQIQGYLSKVQYGPNFNGLSGTLQPSGVNPNFKQPTSYQAPRTIRFLARLTF